MEVALATSHSAYDGFVNRWGSVLTTSLVAIGVFGEIQFGRMGYRREHELKLRSDEKFAAANVIAEQARKEAAEARERTALIEKLTAWRRISKEQYRQIVGGIKPKASTLDVLIQHEHGDTEACSYALDIAHALLNAGVEKEKVRFGANSFIGQTVFGVATALSMDCNTLVLDIFRQAGVPLKIIYPTTDGILPHNERQPNWYIFVGPKPLPPYEEEAALRESNI